MYKIILFETCSTEYRDSFFDFALNMAQKIGTSTAMPRTIGERISLRPLEPATAENNLKAPCCPVIVVRSPVSYAGSSERLTHRIK